MFISDIPHLFKEWDFEKNSELGYSPYKMTHGSTKTVFWVCEKGHHFEARIDHRCIMKSGCPYCAGKKPIVGENDFATCCPELLKEWDYERNAKKPSEYLKASNKKVWWICSVCGYRWCTQINHRSQGCICPKCAKKKGGKAHTVNTAKKNGSLAEKRPELLVEWDYEKNGEISPYDVSPGSNKKVWWKCSVCGYSYRQGVSARCGCKACPVCCGRVVSQGRNDLASQNPEIAKEWHPTKNGKKTPETVSYKDSHNRYWWKCSLGHEWKTTVYSRTVSGSNCPYCVNHFVKSGFNDLKTLHPNIAEEWDFEKNKNLLPSMFTPGSTQKVWWKCKICNTSWSTTISSRVSGCGCPTCGKFSGAKERNKRFLSERGALADTFPKIAKEWHPTKNGKLSPNDVLAGSEKKVWWKCSKGHEWQSVISSRVAGRGCPTCTAELHTSFPEQAILFYFSKVTEALNRHYIDGREIDVYLPELSVGIEYNGLYYHQNREVQDSLKVQFFNERGIRVIQVREAEEDSLVCDDVIFYKKRKTDHYTSLKSVIEILFQMLSLENPDVDIERDTVEIREQYIKYEKDRSFAAVYPELAKTWDYEKNGNLLPSHFSFGSGKKVWWRCPDCGYSFEAALSVRPKSGCPRCSGRIAITGKNDLKTKSPSLAQDWDFEKNKLVPEIVPYRSRRNVWWICHKCKHTWQDTVINRRRNPSCPNCGSGTEAD